MYKEVWDKELRSELTHPPPIKCDIYRRKYVFEPSESHDYKTFFAPNEKLSKSIRKCFENKYVKK